MSRDVIITFRSDGGLEEVTTKPGALGGCGAHYWELREHLNNRGFVDWDYWLGLPTWTAFEAGCLADAVDPNKFEPDSTKDQAGRCGLRRRDDLTDTVFLSGTEANYHVRDLIRLCGRHKDATTPAEWAVFLADKFRQTPIGGKRLYLPTAWVGLDVDGVQPAPKPGIDAEPEYVLENQLQSHTNKGLHGESLRNCHLIPATEASEILEKIFPGMTRKYWKDVINKKPKWLFKDVNNQFGGMSCLLLANNGKGGSGNGPTFVYLPIILVRFILHSKTAEEAGTKLHQIRISNVKPLSDRLAYGIVESCANWILEKKLKRLH